MKGNEQSVASTEIVRNFSVWQNRSADRPVYILHHGRPRSVLLSLDQYRELAAGLGSQDEREERLRPHLHLLLARMKMMLDRKSVRTGKNGTERFESGGRLT